MKTSLTALLGALACASSMAQGAPAGNPESTAAAPTAEPVVRRTVVEDGGSRIEELRVRGQVQRITVQPKVGGAKAFEIIPGEGGRASGDNQGAAGKRVWHVFSF